MSEHLEQVSFFDEAAIRANQDPRWSMIFAIPNGGIRHKVTAGKLKAEGVKAGVPDIFVAVPSFRYPGLFIEMKFGKNKPSKKQMYWINWLRIQGYWVAVCYSAAEAIETVTRYFEGDV